MRTDDHVQEAQEPEWVLNRDAVMNDKLYLAGYRFAGDLMSVRVPLSAVSPANAAARAWSPHDSATARPRYMATHRIEVNNRVVHEGQRFFSDLWPPKDGGWLAANPSAKAVEKYQHEHAGEPLPARAWDGNCLNTIEHDAERRRPATPPTDDRPAYPMSGPRPHNALGFRPRDEPSSFTPSRSPSSAKFPPRTFVKPR